MPISTRTCILCGKQYQYCNNCRNVRVAPAYSSEFDTENCRDIFQICTDFNMGLITKEAAKTALLKCDLSGRENFAKGPKSTINKILADDKKKEFIPKKPTHEVVK